MKLRWERYEPGKASPYASDVVESSTLPNLDAVLAMADIASVEVGLENGFRWRFEIVDLEADASVEAGANALRAIGFDAKEGSGVSAREIAERVLRAASLARHR